MDIMNMSSSFIEENIEYITKFIPEYAKFIPDVLRDFVTVGYSPWLFSMLGAVVIGLSGILPLFIIPKDELETAGFKDPGESKLLKVLLSFAVGGLLGDVFLHLLPEAWEHDGPPVEGGHQSMRSGLLVLSGILIFTIVEKIFSGYVNADDENPQPKCVEITNCLLRRTGGKLVEGQTSHGCTGGCDIEDVPNGCYLRQREEKMKEQRKEVAGYLNLLANSIDNFTHGLAVAGSFLVSFRHGVLATFAILLHEIPHEVGDFAILLRSGFTRWDAARAQLLTASAGLMGAVVAIGGSGVTSAMEARTSWIMPFTAGGFLHIALVTVLPEIVKEENLFESLKQILAIIFGIVLMATMNILFDC